MWVHCGCQYSTRESLSEAAKLKLKEAAFEIKEAQARSDSCM